MYSLYIVEDEQLEIEAIRLIIEQYTQNIDIVGTAHSGKQALNDIRRLRPDVVLMDINIPEMNGIEVLKIIKKEEPTIKVIIITAFNEFDFAHQAIKARVDDFLLKPIRPKQLVESINTVIKSLNTKTKNLFDEKMSDIIFAVVQRRYRDTRLRLNDYLNALYDHYQNDIASITSEVQLLMNELNIVSKDTCNYELKYHHDQNNQHMVMHFQTPYELKVEIMKVLDPMFDRMIASRDDCKNNIEDIVNYIDRNCHKDISLQLVGEYANMSSYYLSKIFKKETNVNFVTYLTERKVELAKEMLANTDAPIINIAMELSYQEPNYFSKVFNKHTVMTPTEYRRSIKRKKRNQTNA